jgi:hypothetical protein
MCPSEHSSSSTLLDKQEGDIHKPVEAKIGTCSKKKNTVSFLLELARKNRGFKTMLVVVNDLREA